MRKAVDGLIDALNRRELDKALGHFVTDCRIDAGPWFDQPLVGKPAMKAFLENFLHALPGLKLSVGGLFANREEAVVTVEVRATMSQLNPDPAHIRDWRAGRKVVWSGAFFITFTPDRRISALRIFGDSSELRWLPSEPAAA